MIYCDLGDAPIDLNVVRNYLTNSGHGAEILFLGNIRDFNQGRRVKAVAYEAFIPLAKKTFYEICEEAQKRWGSSLCAVVTHRVGKLQVGEASVVIGVSLPHRGEAYQASRYIIDELKHRAPIWKKEYYEDGESEWLQGHALCQSHS